MPRLGIVPVRLGTGTESRLTPTYVLFYRSLAQDLIGSAHEVISEEISTLPIPEYESADHRSMLANRVRSQWDVWVNQDKIPSCLLVDLMSEAEDLVTPVQPLTYLLSAICELHHKFENKLRHVILVLNDEISESDSVIVAANQLISNKVLLLVDPKGDVIGAEGRFQIKEFRQRLDEARNPDGARRKRGANVARKLVTIFGFFRSPNSSRTVENYFDGRYAVREICDEIGHLLPDYADNTTLLYDPKDSSWAVEVVGNIFNEGKGKYKRCPIDQALRATIVGGDENFVMLLSVLDTGKTLENLLAEIRRYNIVVSEVLAMVCTNHLGCERDDFSLCGVKVRRLLYVDRRIYHNPASVDGLVEEPPDLDSDQPVLSAFEFWGMARQAGYKGEDDVPRHRPALPAVPDFPEVARKYGVWIAHKLKRLIDTELGDGQPVRELVIVHPAERGAEPLAAALQDISLRLDIVAVPRPIINLAFDVDSGKSPKDSLRHELEKVDHRGWQEKLKAKAQSYRVVILDEFTLSERTFQGLSYLLDNLGQRAALLATLADFRPKPSRVCDSEIHSLYRCPVSFYSQADAPLG